eukprot:1156303-Pelagomonas_calceolata.AAC.4
MELFRSFAHHYQLTHHLHVIPAGIYASQIWATPYLQRGQRMSNHCEHQRLHGACQVADLGTHHLAYRRQCQQHPRELRSMKFTFRHWSALPRKEKKNYVGRGNSPYINLGKGDTLAQKSRESPPPLFLLELLTFRIPFIKYQYLGLT